MRLVSISDVHIKEVGDEPYNLFIDFLNHPKTKAADHIVFLGDIFDLAVGGAKPQYQKFQSLFDKMIKLTEKAQLYYFEGNHDFHLNKLIDLLNEKTKGKKIFYSNKTKLLKIEDRNILISHGDDIELNNEGYMKYKNFIMSKGINLLANYIVPFKIVQMIGNYSSSKSRENNVKKYQSEEFQKKLKLKFRETFIKETHKYNLDFLLCGHSHVKDMFEQNEKVYINNGYFPSTKSFIYISGNDYGFIDL